MGANAGTAVPVYASGEVLTAARLNLTNCGVPVFSGTATRDEAFGGSGEKVLAEGQLAYLEDADVVQYYTGAAWATVGPSTSGVVQVQQATKLNTFSTTSTTFVDVTGLSVSITPTSASNKVLFIVTIGGMGNAGSYVNILQLLRDSTNILEPSGGTDKGAVQLYQGSAGTGDNWCLAQSLTVLDSPATTSATTYKVQARVNQGTLYINRLPSNANFTAVSTVTVMEVLP